jgi:hypothetical protein
MARGLKSQKFEFYDFTFYTAVVNITITILDIFIVLFSTERERERDLHSSCKYNDHNSGHIHRLVFYREKEREREES